MKRINIIGLGLVLMVSSLAKAQDLTALEGWQIRPDYTVLKPGQSMILKAAYCISDQGVTNTGAKLYDCDDADVTPLIGESTVTDWSVNGIPGGNSEYGTIKKSDNTSEFGQALYTAPSRKPALETVQISAIVLPDKIGEKIMVVATVVILDPERTYFGKVRASGTMHDMQLTAEGSLVLKETMPNTGSYSTIAGSLRVQLVTDCGVASGTVPISGDMQLWTHKVDRNEIGPGIYGDSYYLAIMPEPLEVACQGMTLPVSLVEWFMPCDRSIVESDPDNNSLWGEGTCGESIMSWRLERQ